MPHGELRGAVATTMLHILQPLDAERDAAAARDGAETEGPATFFKGKRKDQPF